MREGLVHLPSLSCEETQLKKDNTADGSGCQEAFPSALLAALSWDSVARLVGVFAVTETVGAQTFQAFFVHFVPVSETCIRNCSFIFQNGYSNAYHPAGAESVASYFNLDICTTLAFLIM